MVYDNAVYAELVATASTLTPLDILSENVVACVKNEVLEEVFFLNNQVLEEVDSLFCLN